MKSWHLPDEAHLDGGQQGAGVEGPASQRDRCGGLLTRQGLCPEGEVVACGVLHRRAPAGGGVDVPEVVVPPSPFARPQAANQYNRTHLDAQQRATLTQRDVHGGLFGGFGWEW